LHKSGDLERCFVSVGIKRGRGKRDTNGQKGEDFVQVAPHVKGENAVRDKDQQNHWTSGVLSSDRETCVLWGGRGWVLINDRVKGRELRTSYTP